MASTQSDNNSEPVTWPARYLDGQTSKPHATVLRVTRANLIIAKAENPSDVLAVWRTEDVRDDRQARNRGDCILKREGYPEVSLDLGPNGPDMGTLKQWFPDLGARSAVQTREIKSIVMYLGLAVAGVAGLFFILVPYFSDRIAELVPESYAVELGDSVIRHFEKLPIEGKGFGLCADARANAILTNAADRLARAMDIPRDRSTRVVIVQSKIKNAAAVPGGRMMMFQGLINLAENGDQIAAVLAHELGHVKHRDPLRQTVQASANGILIGLIVGDITGGAALSIAAEQALNATYSQDAELRADAESRQAMETLGADPAHLGGILSLLTKDNGGKAPGWMQIFATHPELKDRFTGEPNPNQTAFQVISEPDFQHLKSACRI